MKTIKYKTNQAIVFTAQQLLHLYLQGINDFAFIDDIVKEMEKSPSGHSIEKHGLSFVKTDEGKIEIVVVEKGKQIPAVAQKLLLLLVGMLSNRSTASDISTMGE